MRSFIDNYWFCFSDAFFFLPLPNIFPITSPASEANTGAIGNNPPFSVVPLPYISLLFLKHDIDIVTFYIFYTAMLWLVFLHCTLYSSL